MHRGDEEARPGTEATAAPTRPHADCSIRALTAFGARLQQHRQECDRAFSSLHRQVEEAIALQQAATANAAGGQCGDAEEESCVATTDVVRATHVLFRYLFESLYAHQLDASQDLVEGLERALAQPSAAPPARRVPALREALHVLSQTPQRVLRAQCEHATEMPLMSAPQPAAARGAPTVAAVQRQRPTFALSAAYAPAQRAAIAQRVEAALRSDSRVLAEGTAPADEEAAARALGCCCLVTEQPAAAGRPAGIARTTMEHLWQGTARRAPRAGPSTPSSACAALAPARPATQPPDAAGDGVAAAELREAAEEDEADRELSDLLEQLDGAVFNTADGVASPLLSQPGLHVTALAPEPSSSDDSADSAARLEDYPRWAKRPRAYIVEKASASCSSARDAEDAHPNAPRVQRRRASTGSDADAPVLAAAAEWARVPVSQLSMLESQTVHYRHVDSREGGELVAALVAAADPGDEAERRVLKARPPSTWLFQVSNSCRERRRAIVEAIRGLGSEVDTGSLYNAETTHLVVADGLTERTEKYLSACAAGKLIVPPRYIFESARRGRWLLGQMGEFNANPLRRFPQRAIRDGGGGGGEHDAALAPPFAGWRVLLLVSHPSVASGIGTVLRAGGCNDLQTFIFNAPSECVDGAGSVVGPSASGCTENLSSACVLQAALLEACTHVLVECLTMSAAPGCEGCFEVPPWFPPSLARQDLYPRIFTLELLYYCLCMSPSQPFDRDGRLTSESAISPSCRVEPMEKSLARAPQQ